MYNLQNHKTKLTDDTDDKHQYDSRMIIRKYIIFKTIKLYSFYKKMAI